jgi:hypothetical protein
MYCDTNDDPATLIYSGNETTFKPDDRLALYSQYGWKVIAKDDNNGSSTSEINRFDTRGALFSNQTNTAQFSPRQYFSFVQFKDKLWVIAGGDNDGRKNDVWASSDGINWTEVNPNAEFSPRYAHTVAVFGDKIWIIGGEDDDGAKNDVWFSDDGINWKLATSSAGFSPRLAHAAVVFDEKMWVVGGSVPNELGEVMESDVWYTTNGVTWTQATASPGFDGRFFHYGFVFDNKMWIMGGLDRLEYKNDIWSSMDGFTWVKEADDVDAVRTHLHCGVNVFDNKIWIIGGTELNDGNPADNIKNDVLFSRDGITWQEVTDDAPFSTRVLAASAVFENKLWILGGLDTSGILKDVWTID